MVSSWSMSVVYFYSKVKMLPTVLRLLICLVLSHHTDWESSKVSLCVCSLHYFMHDALMYF